MESPLIVFTESEINLKKAYQKIEAGNITFAEHASKEVLEP